MQHWPKKLTIWALFYQYPKCLEISLDHNGHFEWRDVESLESRELWTTSDVTVLIFIMHILRGNVYILIKMSLKNAPKYPIDSKPTLAQAMA